jgi:two-component system chemotaxis response regulator CheY
MAYNILVVDDSSLVRKVLRKTLSMTSVDVASFHEAENGKVGLEILKSNWVDLIFLDINMPVMNGIEFMQALHQDQVLKTIPVVVVSTEGSKERKEELEKLGIRAYLRKPATPEGLVETIESILGGEGHGK